MECESYRHKVAKLAQRVAESHPSQPSTSKPSNDRHLVEVLDTCNSSKIEVGSHTAIESVWGADPCTFNNVTSSECIANDFETEGGDHSETGKAFKHVNVT